jgi:hydroxypyruvate reductase
MLNLLQAAQQAIEKCRGDRLVATFFSSSLDWFTQPWYVIAIGKAAGAMTAGALSQGKTSLVSGLVVAKQGSQLWFNDDRIQVYYSAHPVPDETSFIAGDALVSFVHALPDHARVLFLLSGGASSLVEVLPENWTQDTWQQQTKTWLASGWDIQRINAQRKSWSLIKGGKLLDYFPASASVLQLIISDVAEDNLDVVGSGLIATQPEDKRVERYCLANNRYLLNEISQQVTNLVVHIAYVVDEVSLLAQKIVEQAQPNTVMAWGGEPVVLLPLQAGKGGRMQHLALYVAWLLRNVTFDWSFLAIGSDGSDGATDDAGALVDQNSIQRAISLGWDIEQALNNYAASDVLSDIDALVYTGDTGTNVNDLMLLSCEGKW